jgi:hypothetical protein
VAGAVLEGGGEVLDELDEEVDVVPEPAAT